MQSKTIQVEISNKEYTASSVIVNTVSKFIEDFKEYPSVILINSKFMKKLDEEMNDDEMLKHAKETYVSQRVVNIFGVECKIHKIQTKTRKPYFEIY